MKDSPLFAVIRHTMEVINPGSLDAFSQWNHYVWLFDEEEDAMSWAVNLLDSPLLQANEHYFAQAIESLISNRYFQVAGESVAIGEVITGDDFEIEFLPSGEQNGEDQNHLH